jgi:hypothetical protein
MTFQPWPDPRRFPSPDWPYLNRLLERYRAVGPRERYAMREACHHRSWRCAPNDQWGAFAGTLAREMDRVDVRGGQP